MKLMLK